MTLRRLLRIGVKAGIALFCLWHMAAIGTYSLINTDGHPVLEYLVSKRYIFRPYVLATSQWQRWNLFSPDPLRRVTYFHFDIWRDSTWVEIHKVHPETLGFMQRAPELKYLRRIEYEDRHQPLRKRYTEDVCRQKDLPPGTRIRLRKRYFVIPKSLKNKTKQEWNAWQPTWKEKFDITTVCPHRA